MISIIIPSYNREAYLAETIESIKAQTYKDWELIIVDDGSTDDSERLYDHYKSDKIKIVYGKHQGIASARNLGISYAQGEYIAVFDSDDIMHPQRLKKNLKALKDVDFVTSWYYLGDQHGKILNMIQSPETITLDDIKNNNSWPHFMITACRECFLENPYRANFTANDDAGLVWDWFKAGYTYKVIKEPLGIARIHPTNTTKTKQKKINKVQSILNKEYEKWEQQL